MNNEQGFKATRSFTVLLSTLLAGVMAFVFLPYFALVKNNVFMLVLGPAILATIAMFAPLRYVVSDSGIIVKRLGADIEISFETVKHVEQIDRKFTKSFWCWWFSWHVWQFL